MKKLIILLLFLLIGNLSSVVFATTIEASGEYRINLTGYDVKYVRNMQDKKMNTKAQNSHFEVLQNQQEKEAIRQAKKRNKLSKELSQTMYESDKITEAEDFALLDAIRDAIKQVKGEEVFEQYPETENKLQDVVKNSPNFVLEKNYDNSEMRASKNEYISRVHLTIDKNKFEQYLTKKEIKSCYNATINNHSILIVMDQFWAPASNLNQKTATKEVITYKYDKNESESDKEAYKSASSNKNAYAGYYGKSGSTSSSGTTSAKSYNYKNNESVFFQHLTEYAPNFPKAQGHETQSAFGAVLKKNGIQYKNSDIVKSKFFKGKPITADVLKNSAQLVSFVDAIRKDPTAKADYIAIGFSYIVDNGESKTSSDYESSGDVNLIVYSTTNGEVLAEAFEKATGGGISPDDAKNNVAARLGEKLGNNIAEQIRNSYINKKLEGELHNIVFKGKFTLGERSLLYDALEQTNGITDLTEREANDGMLEYSIKYSGKKSLDMVIFGVLTKCSLSDKFQDKTKKEGTNIIFYKKGVPCL